MLSLLRVLLHAVVMLAWSLGFWPLISRSLLLLSQVPGPAKVIGDPLAAFLAIVILGIVWIVGMIACYIMYSGAAEPAASDP